MVPVVADVEGGGEAASVFFEAADAGFEGLAFGALGPEAEGHGWYWRSEVVVVLYGLEEWQLLGCRWGYINMVFGVCLVECTWCTIGRCL